MHADSPGAACANCDAALPRDPPPRYCWSCGQETTLHEPTLFEFAHEFVGHYVAVEGTLWPTLAALVASPGRLTRDYLAGRRRRYVLPLRLYLSASFIFFLVVKVFGATSDVELIIAPAIDSRGHPITAASNRPAYDALMQELQACRDGQMQCGWWKARMAGISLKADTFSSHPQDIVQRVVSLAPYAVFALLPLFAGIVMLAWRKRHLNYGAHFVFSLHTHAAWFLVLTVLALVPSRVSALGLVVLPIYALLSMRRVYGDGWWETFWRGAVVAVLYCATLFAALLAISLASVAAA